MITSRFSLVPRSLLALTLVAGGLQTAANAARVEAAPEGIWQLQAVKQKSRPDLESMIPATRFQTSTVDLDLLKSVLSKAPLDKATADSLGVKRGGRMVEITLPMAAKGVLHRFRVEEVSIMAPELAARYPDIKTYRGVGIDDPSARVALDVTPAGFHAQILSRAGRVYISPLYFAGADNVYASYRKDDAKLDPTFEWFCDVATRKDNKLGDNNGAGQPELPYGGTLRTYRLALAANSFYVATTGGTKATALAEMVKIMNRVSAIYEGELGIRLNLIANEDAIIYPDAATDPFVGNGTGVINTSTAVINAAVGVDNYDIGHVFTTGSGGVAGLGVVCGSTKARGTTGLPNPKGDAFSVDFVAHEMGHEFGGNHTFNGNTGNCSGGNRSAAHAYEPGSGTSIMAYAGICTSFSAASPNNPYSDLQPNSDSFFHHESIREIQVYTAGTGGTCPVVTSNGNAIPVVDAGADYTIPKLTPFTLMGVASDPNGDLLTYAWEERDLGAAQPAAANPPGTAPTGTAVDNGAAPIFRSFTPVYTPSRTFPKVSDLLNNTFTVGEQLPSAVRAAGLNFRLTVRDNRFNGGATSSDDMVLTVATAAGPFLVTSPNTAITTAAGAPLTVTWDVASTNLPPVSTAAVSITLSVDGGYTYPITLSASTANDGSEVVTIPAGLSSTTARVKVAAVGNVYFDISNANFTIN